MTTLQFIDTLYLVIGFVCFVTIVYQYYVIKRQRKSINRLVELQKELNITNSKLVNSLEAELEKMHKLSQLTTEKPKKKVAKKTTKKV